MPTKWDDFEAVESKSGTDWNDFEPVSSAVDESGYPAGMPAKERKRLDLLTERAAESKRGDVATAEAEDLARQESNLGFAEAPHLGIGNAIGRVAANIGGYGDTYKDATQWIPEELKLHVPTDDTSAIAGVGRFGANLINSTLENPVQLPAFGGGALMKLLAVTPMAKELPEQLRHAWDVVHNPQSTKADVAEAVTAPAATSAFLGLAAHSPATPSRIAPEHPTMTPEAAAANRAAVNLASPGTVRPAEIQRVGPPAGAEAPPMFEAGEVPFQNLRRFGSKPLPPVEVLPQMGRLVDLEILDEPRTPQERETRGKVSFGAEAPTLLRTAEVPPEVRELAKSAEAAGLTRSVEAASNQNPSYRRPKPAPTPEEAARAQRRANVEEGLTIEQPPMEPLPPEEGQFPPPVGMPTGTFSNLQRSRILAGKENVRSNVSNNPPEPAPRKTLKQIREELEKGSRGGERGGIDPTILEDIAAHGRNLLKQGMDFAQWSAEMIKQFGEAVIDHLAPTWRTISSKRNTNAIQEQSSNAGVLRAEEPEVGLPQVGARDAGLEKAAEGAAPRATEVPQAQETRPLIDQLRALKSTEEGTALGRTLKTPEGIATLEDGVKALTDEFRAGKENTLARNAAREALQAAKGEEGALVSQAAPEAMMKLRELTGDSNTNEAMALGAKVPKEAIPELEKLVAESKAEAEKVIAEVDAMKDPTGEDLARMSKAGNKSQLLSEALEAANGGKPAILARTTGRPAVATEPAAPQVEGDIISKLESLKVDQSNKGKLYTNPIKDLPVALWNGALDTAILAVKAGRSVADAIELAITHIKKQINKFDEDAIRKHFDYVLKNETTTPEKAKAVSGVPAGQSNAAGNNPVPGQQVAPGNVVPDTAGESVRMRQSAERATTSPMVPEPVQETIRTAPESRYTQQSMERVEDVVAKMKPEELAAVPNSSNLYTAARLEQAKRLFAEGQNDAGYQVFVELEKEGTRFGQLINQFKLLKGTRPEEIVAVINKKLTQAGKDILTKDQTARALEISKASKEADTALTKAADEWSKAPTPENAAKAEAALEEANQKGLNLQQFVHKFQPTTLAGTLKAVLQGNLLTPISEAKNIFGNISFLPFRAGTRAVASSIDAIDAFIRNKPREVTVQPVAGTAEALKGIGRGMAKIPSILIKGSGNTIKGETRTGLHPIQAWINQFAEHPDMPTTGGKLTLSDRLKLAVEGTFGVPAEAMLRGLGAGDIPFREAAQARITAEQLSLAKVPREQWGFAQKFPELFLPKEALEQIRRDTADAVFQGDSKTLNLLTQWLRGKGEWADFAAATVAPYKLTPWNIIGEILSYNPAIAMARGARDAVKGDTRAAKLNAGKAVVGSMLIGTGVWLYEKGLLAPSLDEKDEAQKSRVLAGKVLPPNHINVSGLRRALNGGDPAFKAGDETVDIFGAGGLAGAMFYMTANIGRDLERGPKASDSELIGSILRQSTLEQARFGMNQSFLSGVEGLLSAIKEGNGDNFVRQWAQTVAAIPAPNSLNTLARVTREYQPDVKADTFKGKMENLVKTKLGAFGADDKLPIKRDFWGEPMRETPEGRNAIFYHFFDITKNKQVTSDPVELELYRLWRKTGNANVIPSLPERTATFQKTTYALTPEQYDRYAELIGKQRREITDAIVVNPNFHALSDELKIKRLEEVYRRGAENGKAKFYLEERGKLAPKSNRAGFGN